jgi:hypothetical protein
VDLGWPWGAANAAEVIFHHPFISPIRPLMLGLVAVPFNLPSWSPRWLSPRSLSPLSWSPRLLPPRSLSPLSWSPRLLSPPVGCTLGKTKRQPLKSPPLPREGAEFVEASETVLQGRFIMGFERHVGLVSRGKGAARTMLRAVLFRLRRAHLVMWRISGHC